MAVALCAIITPVAMQWLMAFEAANPVMLYLLGWCSSPGLWPLAVGAGDGDQRHQLRSLLSPRAGRWRCRMSSICSPSA
nr:Sensor protein KdpD [Klebsiella pneumoniae]